MTTIATNTHNGTGNGELEDFRTLGHSTHSAETINSTGAYQAVSVGTPSAGLDIYADLHDQYLNDQLAYSLPDTSGKEGDGNSSGTVPDTPDYFSWKDPDRWDPNDDSPTITTSTSDDLPALPKDPAPTAEIQPVAIRRLNAEAESFYPPHAYTGHYRDVCYPLDISYPVDIERDFPGVVSSTPCHINGRDFVILKQPDTDKITFDYVDVGRTSMWFHYDKVVVSIQAAMRIGRRAFMPNETANRKVRVHGKDGATAEVSIMAVMPSVTITIGDIYEFTTDIFVVPEVDENYYFDAIIGSLLLLQPDASHGRKCIGYQQDGAFHIHRPEVIRNNYTSRHHTECASMIYDFGGDRVLSTFYRCHVPSTQGYDQPVTWAYYPSAANAYISERTVVGLFRNYENGPHVDQWFGDAYNEFQVTIVGMITLDISFNRTVKGTVRLAVTRGGMPAGIIMNARQLLTLHDKYHPNILVDSPVGAVSQRYTAVPEIEEVWATRGEGPLDWVYSFGEHVRSRENNDRIELTTLSCSSVSLQSCKASANDEHFFRETYFDPPDDLDYLSALPFYHAFRLACGLYCRNECTMFPTPFIRSDFSCDWYDREYYEEGLTLSIPVNAHECVGSAFGVCPVGEQDLQYLAEINSPSLYRDRHSWDFDLIPDPVYQLNSLMLECNAKYKSVAKKVRPLNVPLPTRYSEQRFFRPTMSRDPYESPLTSTPPEFQYGGKLTKERIVEMHFGPEGWLSDAEKNLLLHVLRLREGALAFDRSEKGCLKQSYASDYVIPVVDHVPWQDKQIPLSKAQYPKIIELLKAEIAAGDLEPSYSPYCTRWFVVQKKDGRIRKVDGAESLNAISIRDSGVPPNVEEFQTSFAGRVSYSLADMLSGYDQRRLAEESRDLTTIRTPLGLLRRTRLPQGYTNAVAEFQRTMVHVLAEEHPNVADGFIDDVGIKGPESYYNDEAMVGNPGIRRWVFEHAVTLERVLFRLEEAGLTASGKKLVVIAPALEIIGTVVSREGRRITKDKLNKIGNWPNPCPNVHSLRGFLGLVGFVRPFIQNFAIDDYPLRKLLEKGRKYVWTDECSRAVESLKKRAGDSGILYKIDYTSGREIILAVDSSHIATGIVIYQLDEDGNRLPIRFESLGFNDRESRYSQPKLELCGVYKAFRKVRQHIFGTHFTLEVDAKSIQQMLNAPELPNAPMTRWIAFIKLFDFDLRHVSAAKHKLPDALSRKDPTPEDDEPFDADEEADKDLDVWNISLALGEGSRGRHVPLPNRVWLIEDLYRHWEDWLHLGRYLQSGTIDDYLSSEVKRNILRRAPGFYVRNGRLFRRSKRGIPQEVVLFAETQRQILEEMHEKAGHRGRDAVLGHIRERFWWPKMYESVRDHVRSCDQCQRRHTGKEKEISRPTVPSRLFQKVGIDLVHLGEGSGPFPYLIVARDDLSNWVEATHVGSKHAEKIKKFIEQDLVCRYGPVMEWITTDGGGETKREAAAYLERLHIPIVRSVPYHPEANGMIERGHGPLVEACLKMAGARKTEWHKYLPTALWADRITTRRTTGKSPFELVFGAAPLLPVDIEFETWLFTEWRKRMSTSELLEARMRQIARRDEDLVEALRKLAESRRISVAYLDKKMAHRLRQPLRPGTLVLQHDTKLTKQWSHRVKDRWFGPFVVERQHQRGSYYLREVDGAPRAIPVAAQRLRRFFPRGRVLQDSDYQSGGEDDFADMQNVEDEAEESAAEIRETAREDVVPPLASAAPNDRRITDRKRTVRINRRQDIPLVGDDEEDEEAVRKWAEARHRYHYPQRDDEDSDEDCISVEA